MKPRRGSLRFCDQRYARISRTTFAACLFLSAPLRSIQIRDLQESAISLQMLPTQHDEILKAQLSAGKPIRKSLRGSALDIWLRSQRLGGSAPTFLLTLGLALRDLDCHFLRYSMLADRPTPAIPPKAPRRCDRPMPATSRPWLRPSAGILSPDRHTPYDSLKGCTAPDRYDTVPRASNCPLGLLDCLRVPRRACADSLLHHAISRRH
jgi:hypothetical protein